MRRLIWIAASVVVLVGAGIAIAHGDNGKSIKQVSATFAATTASNLRTNTCTATDGTYETTRADYTGNAISTEPTLNGTASVSAKSVINTTTGFGTVNGRLRIDTADGKHTVATLIAELQKLYSKAEPKKVEQDILDYLQLLHDQRALDFAP